MLWVRFESVFIKLDLSSWAQDCYNVEADHSVSDTVLLAPCLGTANNLELFFAGDGGGRVNLIRMGAAAHLYENQRIAVHGHKIDLTQFV